MRPAALWHRPAVTEPERFFFCHLQKTGGTSLLIALLEQFGDDAVYPLPDERESVDAVIDVDHLRRVFEAKGDQIRVVTGHFPLCTTELLGVPFRTFTVLRDPVERTLSYLRHQRRLERRYAEMSLEEAYGVPQSLFGLIHNHQVKMLGMTAEEMTAGAMTFVDFEQAHLDRAKAALDRMDVVGVQDDFALFQRTLDATFGWDLGEPVRANTTRREPPTGAFAAQIARDNALDGELYRYAGELVARRQEQRPV